MSPFFRVSGALLGILSAPLSLHAMARKEACTIRIYVEVDSSTADPFAVPVRVGSPTRHLFHESGASISERQIAAAHVYQNPSGEWVALFQLDAAGRMVLHNISSANRGRSLIAYVGDAKITRVLPDDILIDRVVTDGVIQIRGLLPKEVYLIQKHFPQLKLPSPSSR